MPLAAASKVDLSDKSICRSFDTPQRRKQSTQTQRTDTDTSTDTEKIKIAEKELVKYKTDSKRLESECKNRKSGDPAPACQKLRHCRKLNLLMIPNQIVWLKGLSENSKAIACYKNRVGMTIKNKNISKGYNFVRDGRARRGNHQLFFSWQRLKNSILSASP